MGTPFVDECLPLLARTPATFDALLRELPPQWTEATEGPGTWSPRDVLGHLVHCEKTDWLPRLKIILEYGPSRSFDPVDREGHFRESANKPLPALLDEFSDLRRDSLAFLRALDLQPAQLELEGAHPALGRVTLRQLLATWTAHDLAHFLQASRVMAKRLRHETGPWAGYLSVMK